jgi:hypothetical protein
VSGLIEDDDLERYALSSGSIEHTLRRGLDIGHGWSLAKSHPDVEWTQLEYGTGERHLALRVREDRRP